MRKEPFRLNHAHFIIREENLENDHEHTSTNEDDLLKIAG